MSFEVGQEVLFHDEYQQEIRGVIEEISETPKEYILTVKLLDYNRYFTAIVLKEEYPHERTLH